jgi:hypothetical protein
MVDTKEIWLIESPVVMVEGEVIAYSVDWLGANKVESPSITVYRNGSDYTSTCMVSGDSHAISGNVLTMKRISAVANDGGSRYVVVIQCSVDNNTEIRKLLIQIVKAYEEG